MPQSKELLRDDCLDILRGMAVFSMIAANMAGSLLKEPHPLGLRLYGTFAAPLFVFISSLLVSQAASQHRHAFPYFLKRCLALLFFAALIDTFIWKIIPFVTIDILYLIAISIPLLASLKKINARTCAALSAASFFMPLVIQKFFGYAAEVHEYSFARYPGMSLLLKQAAHHWFVDGWFPLFPWLGFCFLGALIAKLQMEIGQPALLKRLGSAGLGMILSGMIFWNHSQGQLLTREGYSELFYPPTLGYLFTASGVILMLYWAVQKTSGWKGYRGFKILGRAALLIYLSHLAFIEFVLRPVLKKPIPLLPFLGLYFLTAGLALSAALLLQKIRPKRKNLPYLLKTLAGS